MDGGLALDHRMHPAPESRRTDQSDHGRQLILAQVQLMELEDTRDELTTRLAAAQELLDQTRQLSDRILGEHDLLAAKHRALQTEFEALRTREAELQATLGHTQERATTLDHELQTERDLGAGLAHDLRTAGRLAAQQLQRIEELESERRAMKASRSWRYTATLRSLERILLRIARKA